MTNNWKLLDYNKKYKEKDSNKIVKLNSIGTAEVMFRYEGKNYNKGEFSKCSPSSFLNFFQELPEDNLQETEEEPTTKKSLQVKRALEELKYSLARKDNHEFKGHVFFDGHNEHWRPLLELLNGIKYAAQNLVDALEAEKSLCLKNDQKLDTKEFDSCRVDTKPDMSKPEPKWLPMSCAPKDGSVIIVQQKDNKRHKIFKAQWFLNKWYSLYEEGGNEQVYPEFWLEVSKEEPKIDIKEEHVEPVSIWKDVSESIYHCNFSPDQLCLYEKFIEFFEQMQKDIEEIRRKFTS